MVSRDARCARCRENLEAVRDRIADACRRAGRDPLSVRLVGVTKTVDVSATQMLFDAGCIDLAESRPQSLWKKAELLATAGTLPQWHLIGHLQRNKVQRTTGLLSLLHTLDSLRLLEAIDAEGRRSGRVCDVLVEINLTDDPQRTGVLGSAIEPLVEAAISLPHVYLRGLMGMASAVSPQDFSHATINTAGASDAIQRRQFANLREIRDQLVANLPAAVTLPELSMGMSEDFEAAILEGSTMVRIGSALWEGLADES